MGELAYIVSVVVGTAALVCCLGLTLVKSEHDRPFLKRLLLL